MNSIDSDSQSLPLLLSRLWKHVSKRRRLQFFLLMLLMIISSFAEMMSIGAVLPFLSVITSPEGVFKHEFAKPFIQLLSINSSEQLLLPVTIAFAAAALISGAMRLVLLWASTRLSYALGADLSIEIYRRTLYQPYSIHVARNSSEVIAGITTKANSLINSVIMPSMNMVTFTIMLTAILSALLVVHPIISFSALVGFGLIYSIIITFSRKRLNIYSQHISIESTKLIQALQEGLGGIRDVLLNGTQPIYCQIYRNADLPMRRAQGNVQVIGQSPRFAIEALGMVLIASLAYFLAQSPAGITSAIPVLGALALGAQRLLPILQQAYSSWTSIRAAKFQLYDTLSLLDQPLPSYLDRSSAASLPFVNSIELQNINFCYSSDAPSVLKKLKLNIPKGSKVGFMGTTGAGKSTLIDIIMALLYPDKGELLVDGLPITSDNQREWQAHIAHVPQTIFLADTTIEENIAFGIVVGEINRERVRAAAEKAQIARTIETWPKQYKTKVGERGIRLSGGQRQRIGIARALYKQADVIIFDEATSSLDNKTEEAVMEAIDAIGNEITILIVAHRLTTLKKCDIVFELEGGTVLRQGSYYDMIGHTDSTDS